jgi:hypothetical protein
MIKDSQGNEVKLGSKVVVIRGKTSWPRNRKTRLVTGEVVRIRTDAQLNREPRIRITVKTVEEVPNGTVYNYTTGRHDTLPGTKKVERYSPLLSPETRCLVVG